MKRTRPALLAAAAAVGLGTLAACSGGNGGGVAGKTTITWSTWGGPSEMAKFNAFDKQFMQTHPTINVVLQPVPSYSDYTSKLFIELSSHTAPDVFYVGDDQIGKFVSTGQLKPLNSIMSSSPQISASSFAPGLFGAAVRGGTYYGVPTDCNPDAFWYDKTALRSAGITQDPATLAAQGKWTLATFLDMTAKLHAHGLNGAAFWNYWSTPYSWISQYGGKVYGQDGQFVLPHDPVSVHALQVLARGFQDKSFLIADNQPSNQPDTMFLQHKLGFFVQGRYTIGTIDEGKDPGNYDVAPWPSASGKITPSGVATAYLAINKASPHQAAAATFLRAFVDAQGQTLRLAGAGAAVPSLRGSSADQVIRGYPAHASFLSTMRSLGFEDFAAEAAVPGLSTDMATVYLNLYEGKVPVSTALSQLSALAVKTTKAG